MDVEKGQAVNACNRDNRCGAGRVVPAVLRWERERNRHEGFGENLLSGRLMRVYPTARWMSTQRMPIEMVGFCRPPRRTAIFAGMPELPEVETYVRDLRPHVVGRRITAASLTHPDILTGVTKARLLRTLTGAVITDVTRRAKHAVLHLDCGQRLVVQPGMTGSLLHLRRSMPANEAKYIVLHARLDRGGALVYHDVRRIGTLRLLDDAGWTRFDAAIGPEPLGRAWTDARFTADLAGSRVAIKKFLMDQRKVAGIGNIYANEGLFLAGVDPSRPARSLRAEEAARLRHHTRRILARAIAVSGTTIRDYRTGAGEPGGFQLELFVYGREGEPCKVCGATLTGTHVLDARITVFCHRCQR